MEILLNQNKENCQEKASGDRHGETLSYIEAVFSTCSPKAKLQLDFTGNNTKRHDKPMLLGEKGIPEQLWMHEETKHIFIKQNHVNYTEGLSNEDFHQ